MKFKLGDTVKVTLGKDRGRTGTIEKILPKKNEIIVKGINIYKKHLKPQGQDKPGGIIEIAKPLNLAKIILICPQCKNSTRVGYQGSGRQKIRICKKCQKPIDTKGKKS